MKTVFSSPSNTYTIILSEEDLVHLVERNVIMIRPTITENCYKSANGKIEYASGHYLQYHGPEAGTIPVQFVNIYLERDNK